MASELARAGLRSNPKKVAEVFLRDRNHPVRAAPRPSGSKLPRHETSSTTPYDASTPPVASKLARAGLRSNPKKVAEVFLKNRNPPVRAAPRPSGSKLPRHETSSTAPYDASTPPVASELARAGLRRNPKKVAEVFLKDRNHPVRAAPRPSGSKLPRHETSSTAPYDASTPPVASELARAGLRSNPKKVDEVFLRDRNHPVRAAPRPSGSKLPRHEISSTAPYDASTPPVASELARAGLRSNPKKVAEVFLKNRNPPVRAAPRPSGSKLPRHEISSTAPYDASTPPVASELARAGLRSNPKKVAEVFLKDRNHPVRAAPRPSGSKLPRHEISNTSPSDASTPPVASKLARAGLRSNPKKVAEVLLKDRNHPVRAAPRPSGSKLPLHETSSTAPYDASTPPVASELARAGLRSNPKKVDEVFLRDRNHPVRAAPRPSGSKLPRHEISNTSPL